MFTFHLCVAALSLLLAFKLQLGLAFPSGAPNGACQSMVPGHRSSPQDSTTPYAVTVSRNSYSPNERIQVTINSKCTTSGFEGFMIQARRADINSDTVSPLGSFNTSGLFDARPVFGCGSFDQVQALTHTNGRVKSSLAFTWTAPSQSQGDIVFAVTFLQNYATYWVMVYSEVIQDSGLTTRADPGNRQYPTRASCDPVRTTLPPTTTTTTQPTTTTTPPTTTTTTTQSTTTTPPTTTTTTTQSTTTTPPTTTTTTTQSTTTTSPTTSATQVATTTTQAATKQTITPASVTRIPPPSTPRPLPGTRPPTATNTIASSTAGNSLRNQIPVCSENKRCYSWCPAECLFSLTTEYFQDEILIEMEAKVSRSDNQWIAVGFSMDNVMGKDSVVECTQSSGRIQVYHSYNDGYDNRRIGKEGISEESGSLSDGVFRCSFRRRLGSYTDPTIFDLQNVTQWYIFLASGGTFKDRKKMHDDTPHVSPGKVDLRLNGSVAEEGNKPGHRLSVIRAHGSLMLIAWVFTTSIGIIIARYYKLLGGGATCCNDRYSFHVHRACMTMTLICVTVSIIIIFVEVGGYSKMLGSDSMLLQAHPILGIIVTCLVVINFSMGLLRPSPGRRVRPVYNWGHWATGTCAWILAMVTIFLGLSLPKARVSPAALYVMVGFVVLHLCVQVFLEWLGFNVGRAHLDGREKANPAIYELTTMDSENGKNRGNFELDKPQPISGVGQFKAVILFLYIFALVFLLFALLVLVNKS